MIVRIAAVQYLLRQIHDWSGFENQVQFHHEGGRRLQGPVRHAA